MPCFSFSWFGFEFVFHATNCEKDLVVVRSGPLSEPSFLSGSNDVCLLVQKCSSDDSVAENDLKVELKVFFRSSIDGFSPVVPKSPVDAKQCLEYFFVNAINATTRAYHSSANKSKVFFLFCVCTFLVWLVI